MAANTVIFRQALLRPTPCLGVRNMATLKDIQMRLKSITNIQKITKSMKMVSAAKYSKAEKELKPAQIYGKGIDALYENSEIQQDDSKPNHLILTVSSDRGLCGGIHSSVAKAVRANILEKAAGTNIKIVAIGDKMKQILSRQHGGKFLVQFNDIGRLPPTFAEAAFIAQEIIETGYEYDFAEVFFNKFRSVVSYNTSTKPVFSLNTFSSSENVSTYYDDVDEDVLRSYQEFTLASLIYYCLKEGATSEQSSRMTAMESASQNAGEIIDKLTLIYNRTRQAVITRELTEIISGASALE